MKLPTLKRKQAGFTLLELLIVVAIISILISIGLASFSRVQKSSRDAQRRSDLRNVAGALESFYADNNVYPAGLNELIPPAANYLRELPTDPITGAVYTYVPGGQAYCLVSDDMETNPTPATCPVNAISYKLVVSSQD